MAVRSAPDQAVRITDTDLPALTINDVTVLEGDGGVTDAVFTVRLSAARPAPVSVVCRTRDGSATAPSDY
ncbi:MAG: hypothetical protein RMJ54_13140, partial [Roseiflexaceae bacterium]|nr:hypothetical protein [Roseiflexaceae bacterium]